MDQPRFISNSNKSLYKQKLASFNTNYANRNYYPKSEKIIIFAISASIALPMVDTLINVIVDVQYVDSIITLGIYYSSLLLALYYAFQRFRNEMITVPLLFIGLWLFSYLMFPNNRPFLTDEVILPLITSGLPLFIITLAVKDRVRLYNALRIGSIASIISAVAFVVLQFYGKYKISYMSFSYSMTLPVMLMLIFSFQNKKIIDFIFSITGLVVVFVAGARGPMVGLLSGLFFYLLINIKLNFKNLTLLCIGFIFLIYFAINFDSFISLLSNSLKKLNISSRTIQLLQNNKIEKLSGREVLYDEAILGTKNLFIGNGMAGDRVILGGAYAHNLFLELLLEYGLIVGAIFIIVLIQYLIRSLFVRNKAELYYVFFAIFFTTGFITLQFSFSYLLEPTFFMMLALAIRLTGRRTKIRRPYAQKFI